MSIERPRGVNFNKKIINNILNSILTSLIFFRIISEI